MPFWTPQGFDRADGITPLPANPISASGAGSQPVGTPTPSGALTVQGPSGGGFVIQENVDSPEVERAEQATVQHVMHDMTWSTGLQFLAQMGRGTFVSDSFGNIWRILSSKLRSLRGGNAELSYVAESISFDSPPDDFQMTPVELGIDIIKYPRYFYALYPATADYSTTVGVAPNTATVAQVKQAIIRAIQTYRDSPYFPTQGNLTINGVVQNNIVSNFIQGIIPTAKPGTSDQGSELLINVSGNASCQLAIAAANEIIQKLWYQLDTPYIAGWEIKWTQYFFQPVYINPGGYIEDPTVYVPDYFIQPTLQPFLARGNLSSAFGNLDTLPPVNGAHGIGGSTIFDAMYAINPQCYSTTGNAGGSTSISWLRKADEVVYERTWFRVIHTWVGSPIGLWDSQIYSSGPRPSSPSDYLPLV